MNKYFFVSAIGILFLYFVIAFNDESVIPDESHLSHFSGIEILLPGRLDFNGKSFDIDSYSLSFSFKTSIQVPSPFLSQVKENALNSDWDLVNSSDSSVSFRRLSGPYPEIATLSVNKSTGEILFDLHPDD